MGGLGALITVVAAHHEGTTLNSHHLERDSSHCESLGHGFYWVNGIIGVFICRRPIVRKQVGDQRRHVIDSHNPILVAICSDKTNSCIITIEQIIDQCCHIADVDVTIVIHVSTVKGSSIKGHIM